MSDSKPSLSLEESLKLCKDPEPATMEFSFKHTMYRIKDPKKSLPFYTEVLGMRLVDRADFPTMKFSIYFLGYEQHGNVHGEFGDMKRKAWTMSRQNILELTHNWGTEYDPDFKYHPGNSEPRGFGHIGIMVPDLDEACERFESLGVNFIKRLQDGVMKTIAFIADPDGYWIEIFNNEV